MRVRRLTELPVTQLQHSIRAARQRLIVRDDQQRRTTRPGDREQYRKHLLCCFLVEVPRRLICEQQGWLMHERACYRDALLLAARQGVHGTVKTVAETDFREHCSTALPSLCPADAVELERESDILLDIQRGKQIEELIDETDACAAKQSALRLAQRRDIAAVDFNRAAVRPIDAADEIQESRLARAAASDDRDSLAAGYVRVGLIEHAVNAYPLAKAATKLPDNEHIHCPWLQAESLPLL